MKCAYMNQFSLISLDDITRAAKPVMKKMKCHFAEENVTFQFSVDVERYSVIKMTRVCLAGNFENFLLRDQGLPRGLPMSKV